MHRVADDRALPTFEAFELLDRAGWGVLVTLVLGQTRNLHGFRTKQEAESWIARDSAAWLERIEGGRHGQSHSVRPVPAITEE